MKLEDQVCSLELSKKLKELGVKQESLFYWQQTYSEMKGGQTASGFEITQKKTESKKGMRCFSAFTVAELGEMLPMCIKKDGKEHYFDMGIISEDIRDHSNRKYYIRIEEFSFDGLKTADTEANTRASMLIYLLENKLITL